MRKLFQLLLSGSPHAINQYYETRIFLYLLFAHCLDLDLNSLLTWRNFWCIPGMLEHYTIPKWKEFLKSHEPILRKSYLSTFIHINKHMDGARDTFWIKSLNGTFLALQIKSFGPKKFWFSCMGKKVPFWQFFRIFKRNLGTRKAGILFHIYLQ